MADNYLNQILEMMNQMAQPTPIPGAPSIIQQQPTQPAPQPAAQAAPQTGSPMPNQDAPPPETASVTIGQPRIHNSRVAVGIPEIQQSPRLTVGQPTIQQDPKLTIGTPVIMSRKAAKEAQDDAKFLDMMKQLAESHKTQKGGV